MIRPLARRLLLLAVVCLLASGCGYSGRLAEQGPGGSYEPAAPEIPVVEQDWGDLISFYYEFGSYHGENYQFTLRPQLNGSVLFEGWGYNSTDLSVSAEVDPSVLYALQQLLEEAGVTAWNGFDRAAPDVLDGYGFSLRATYSSGQELRAYGYMVYPSNYEEGHAQLRAFLLHLAEEYPHGEPGIV